MDLLPVTADYDTISEKMREFAAARYMEIIAQLNNHVNEALSDPAGIHDTEPGRLMAYAQLVKLQTTLIKELGALYRVTDRPRVEEEPEPMITVEEHEEALRLAQEREDRAVAAAAETATQAALAAVAHREVLDLDAARDRVARGLKALGR